MAVEVPPRLLTELPPVELSPDQIWIHHPGYPEESSRLLSFPRVDKVRDSDALGVRHRLVLLACQIVAGNSFDVGYLTLDRDGQHRVTTAPDGLLTEMKCYFIIPGVDEYPIVPSFLDWQFPHHRIPDSWPNSLGSSDRMTSRCGMTNVSFAIKRAHLIPKEEEDWFSISEMAQYGAQQDIDDEANILPLRKDLHKCFDDRWFAFVPNVVETGSEVRDQGQYVSCILSGLAAELWPTYHNIIVRHIHPRSRPYLLARFAWAILLKVKLFVTSGFARTVIRLSYNDKAEREYKIERFTGAQLRRLYGGGGRRSVAPRGKKRKLDADNMTQDGYAFLSSDDDTDSLNEDDSWTETESGEGKDAISLQQKAKIGAEYRFSEGVLRKVST